MLGDVVISVDTTEREALEGNVDFETRFYELLIHGILHLLGYDHENDENRAREMEEMSDQVLSKIGGK
jgi:rRNA maturation RNase YbeY